MTLRVDLDAAWLPGPLMQIENSSQLDSGKWRHAMQSVPDLDSYDYVTLFNDSVVLLRPIDHYLKWAQDSPDNAVSGLLQSYEIKPHLQSWCRTFSRSLYKTFLDFVDAKLEAASKNGMVGHIQDIEVGFCQVVPIRGMYSMNTGHPNVMFCNKMLPSFVEKDRFPALKLKKLNYTTYSTNALPPDFDYQRYMEANTDLPLSFTEEDCRRHFQDHGWKEGRHYHPGQKPIMADYLRAIVEAHGLADVV